MVTVKEGRKRQKEGMEMKKLEDKDGQTVSTSHDENKNKVEKEEGRLRKCVHKERKKEELETAI